MLAARDEFAKDKPLLVKISPDLSNAEMKDVAEIVLEKNRARTRIDGLIVSNTTTSRATLPDNCAVAHETGGLSGLPVQQLSTAAIRNMYRLTKGTVPIVGCGGVFTGHDAFEKIKAGASLVQIYTSFAFEGPPIVNAIKRQLTSLLR